MRIAKPLLLVTTPIGLLEGFYECYKLAGGLLFLMVAMVGVMGVGGKAVIAFTALSVSACSASADSFESGDRFLFFSGT